MSKLMEGVVAPDVEAEPQHHYHNSRLSNEYLMRARSYFLHDDLQNSYYCLGRAFHYIQDSYVSCPPYLPRGTHYRDYDGQLRKQKEKHELREIQIDESRLETSIYDIEKMIDRTVRYELARERCSNVAHELSKEVVGKEATLRISRLNQGEEFHQAFGKWPPPFVDLNLGFMACYVAARSVLGPKTNTDVDKQLTRNFEAHIDKLSEAEKGAAAALIASVAKRDELAARRAPDDGFVSRIKNWVTGMKIKSADKSAISIKRRYSAGAHLTEIESRYALEASRIISPNEGWYEFDVPRLDCKMIARELRDTNEATAASESSHESLMDSIRKAGIHVYDIDGCALIRREDYSILCPGGD
ncbi:MAG TPA: hypothetical protein VMB46_06940 [Methanomassiliicoccales archaeon]|nr:hypothetical protein [Methanomassiliicoccales archaeon]